MPQHASWGRLLVYLSGLSLLLLIAGPVLTRLGVLPYGTGLQLVMAAVVAAAVVALGAMLVINPHISSANRRALGIASVLALPGLLCIAFIALHIGKPAIHNISTDTADPPQFLAAPALRGATSNPLTYSAEVAELQQLAYPDIGPITVALAPVEAHQRALAVARAMGWEVYASAPQDGHIEAVDTTFWFGFKDDIAVRIRPTSDGSVVDLRSVSRVGRGDLGANAARIRTFRELFHAAE